MKAVATPTSNLRLVLPGGVDTNDIPAERIRIFAKDETVDENLARQGLIGQPGIQTAWQPDDGERRAIANGAPVILRVWGDRHPPVWVGVGEPTGDAVPLISRDTVDRAAGLLYSLLQDEPLPSAEVFLYLWTTALGQAYEDHQRRHPETNGS